MQTGSDTCLALPWEISEAEKNVSRSISHPRVPTAAGGSAAWSCLYLLILSWPHAAGVAAQTGFPRPVLHETHEHAAQEQSCPHYTALVPPRPIQECSLVEASRDRRTGERASACLCCRSPPFSLDARCKDLGDDGPGPPGGLAEECASPNHTSQVLKVPAHRQFWCSPVPRA